MEHLQYGGVLRSRKGHTEPGTLFGAQKPALPCLPGLSHRGMCMKEGTLLKKQGGTAGQGPQVSGVLSVQCTQGPALPIGCPVTPDTGSQKMTGVAGTPGYTSSGRPN